MAAQKVVFADLDEIIFESREKKYGAYDLRKQYDRSLFRATLVAFLLFSFGLSSPKLYSVLFANNGPKPKLEMTKNVVIEMTEINEPKPEELPPALTPAPEIERPKIKSIEFRAPEAVEDNQVLEDESMHEVDSLEKVTNIGLVDSDEGLEGYDLDSIDEGNTGHGVIDEPKEDGPGINEWINVEKEPGAVNIDDIRRLIGYPKQAVEAEIEGRVTVRILVGKDGRYLKHKVIRSAHPILAKAVELHVEKLIFTPGIQADKPITVWVSIPFQFNLTR